MRIIITNKTKKILTPVKPIVPSDVYPNGMRPKGQKQPLVEYFLMGKLICGANGYTGYN